MTIQTPAWKGEACRACQTEIVFVLTPKRHREPLEREPRRLGDLDKGLRRAARLVVSTGDEAVSLGLGRPELAGERLTDETLVLISHFATCPERARFKRR